MFYTNTTTLLLLHEDRVRHLQKMHEPLPFFRGWNFKRKAKVRGSSSSATTLNNTITLK
jgi:hypothetical protein